MFYNAYLVIGNICTRDWYRGANEEKIRQHD